MFGPRFFVIPYGSIQGNKPVNDPKLGRSGPHKILNHLYDFHEDLIGHNGTERRGRTSEFFINLKFFKKTLLNSV